jgi:hypothetical protein
MERIPQPKALVIYWHAQSAQCLIGLAAAARELEDDERAFRYAVTARALADHACELAGDIIEPGEAPKQGENNGTGKAS